MLPGALTSSGDLISPAKILLWISVIISRRMDGVSPSGDTTGETCGATGPLKGPLPAPTVLGPLASIAALVCGISGRLSFLILVMMSSRTPFWKSVNCGMSACFPTGGCGIFHQLLCTAKCFVQTGKTFTSILPIGKSEVKVESRAAQRRVGLLDDTE